MNTSTNDYHGQKELERLVLRLVGFDQAISLNEKTLIEAETGTVSSLDIITSLISSTKLLRAYRKLKVAFVAEERKELTAAEVRELVGLDPVISLNEEALTEVEMASISDPGTINTLCPDTIKALSSSTKYMNEYRRVMECAIADVREEIDQEGRLPKGDFF